MSGRLSVVEHASASAVFSAYRSEREAVRRSHLQVIWLVLSGEELASVCRVSGFTRRWLRELVRRWNAEGFSGLGDRRRGNCGAAPLLDEAGVAALAAALAEAPEDGGVWSGRQVAAWMSRRLGREVSPKRGLDYLHRLGFSLQRPRPKHARAATAQERAAFKKNCVEGWRRRADGLHSTRSRSGPSTSIASA